MRDHAGVSSSCGVRNRCSCVTSVKTSAATYIKISTPATTPLTTSRCANVARVPSEKSAGISRPVTARASDVACTDADRALND